MNSATSGPTAGGIGALDTASLVDHCRTATRTRLGEGVDASRKIRLHSVRLLLGKRGASPLFQGFFHGGDQFSIGPRGESLTRILLVDDQVPAGNQLFDRVHPHRIPGKERRRKNSQDQHRITVRVEPITLIDRLLVGPNAKVVSHESRNEHQ